MAEAIIMGSGTSNGVPTLGSHYDPAFLANPKNWRTRSCLALLGPTGTVIVDTPPELRLQCVTNGIQMIDAVILSHTHADHIMGLDDIRSICVRTGRPMPVYTLPQYQNDIRRIFDYAFAEHPATLAVPRMDLHDIAPSMELAGLTIRTYIVEHGKWPVIGVRVNDFAYVTDVSRIPDAAMAQLKGLSVMVLDAVRLKPHINHFHFEKALQVAQEIGAKKTYLTHLSDDYDHDITDAALPKGIELAYDGLRIPL